MTDTPKRLRKINALSKNIDGLIITFVYRTLNRISSVDGNAILA